MQIYFPITDVEEVFTYGDKATIKWRYHWGENKDQAVRGVNLMKVKNGKIVEALGYSKTVSSTVSSCVGDLIEEENKVAGTGTVTSKHSDGSLKKSFFSDVYELENGKVKEIKSYMVFEQKQEKG